jgi:ornithine--oxo-acid transaminase
MTSDAFIDLDERYGAPNYHPLPVAITHGDGAWVTDVDGNRYLDFLSAYSALNFGHRHPRLIEAAAAQLGTLTLTSRAVHNDRLGPFLRDLTAVCRMELALPMNTGAEAVETAIKAARKWGYEAKGVPDGRAKVLVAEQNFHGRTTTIISFSGDDSARGGFGPFTPGFAAVPYGDAAALEAAMDDYTVAFLVEPVQGEAGVIVPPAGYLAAVREICTRRNVLMMCDEIQSGFGRTGATFACEHESVQPDVYVLGKAIGGGIVALSAVVSSREVLGRLTPGTHGSTFGGNPLAVAIGSAVLELVGTGEYQERSRVLGAHMLERLRAEAPASVREVRGIGLWAGIELHPEAGTARARCERLLTEGLICKDTHTYTLRLAPPLVISQEDLDWALDRVIRVLEEPLGA